MFEEARSRHPQASGLLASDLGAVPVEDVCLPPLGAKERDRSSSCCKAVPQNNGCQKQPHPEAQQVLLGRVSCFQVPIASSKRVMIVKRS